MGDAKVKKDKGRLGISKYLLIATLAGILVGFLGGDKIDWLKHFGNLLTRLLFMLVPGIVYFSIASAFANIGDLKKVGKWAGKVIGWFILTTIIGIVLGIIFGLIFKPGTGLTATEADIEVQKITANNFLEWVPENIMASFSEGNIIQIVIFAIITGIATILMKEGKSKDTVKTFLNSGQELFLTITHYIMYYAPIGVFALMATSVGEFKGSLLKEMFDFLAAYSIAFIIHIILVYMLMFKLVTGLSPKKFIKHGYPAFITAFATCSSSATLPVTLECVKKSGVEDEIADFGVPLGCTFNMDSMAIEIPLYVMLGMYAIGRSPTIKELILIVIFGIALSIGTAGVPGGGLAIATILVDAFGLPVELVAWIAAVFVYLDVTGTVMNIWGDMTCTTIVGYLEGMLDIEKFNDI